MAYTNRVNFDQLFDESVEFAPSASRGSDAPRAGELAAPAPPLNKGGQGGVRFPNGGGVYLLTDADDRFIQLAAAADLRRALSHRLLDTSGAGSQAVEADGGTAAPVPSQTPPGPPLLRGGSEGDASAPLTAGETPTLQGETPALRSELRVPSALQSEPHVSLAPRRRVDLRSIVRRIRWRPAHSMFEITFEYHRLARALMPATYLKQVGFGPSWFVHVDPAAPAPRFQAGKLLRSPPGVDLGPFATQAEAGRCVEILEDAFDLCRYHHILVQAPGGQACAYFDMGKCPAPCAGSISMDTYRVMIGQALAFACGDRAGVLAGWDTAMRAAAAEREYERAAAIRQRIERARRIEHEAFRLVRPMEAFRYLVVQRGGGTTRVKPFFVRAGRIDAGVPVRMKELPAAVTGWIETLRAEVPAEPERALASEHVWLVSHFLFKRETPGMFVPAESVGAAAELAERIREHFATSKKEELRDLGGDAGVEAGNARPNRDAAS